MSGTAWFANEIRGRHVLIGMIAFFGLIFLANGIFLYYALTTFGGGEKGSPYRSGLRYNETLAEAARAAGLGLNAGHDLDLANLGPFLAAVPGVDEVSIGQALVADALERGMAAGVAAYVAICVGAGPRRG